MLAVTYDTNAPEYVKYGALVTSQAEKLTVWAKVIVNGGGTDFNYAQVMSNNNFQFVVRYYEAFNNRSNWVIKYDNQYFKINSIEVDKPNYRRYMLITAESSINQESWS